MKKAHWKRRYAAAITTLTVVGFATTGLASADPTGIACGQVSAAKVQQIVGLPHSKAVRNTQDSAIRSECDLGLWSGSTPKSLGAVLQRARSGQAAQVGIETWQTPNDGSGESEKWVEEGFEELINGFSRTRFHLVYVVPGVAKSLNPQGDGYPSSGVVIKGRGKAKGLLAAFGCWWDRPSHSAVCVLDEEAKSKPVVPHLNALAKTIVPGFLGH